jgi:azurin
MLTACGGDKPAPAPEPAPAPTAAPEPAKPAEPAPAPAAATEPLKPDAEGVVRLTGDDAMKFNTNRIEIVGTKVKLELKHIGKMPKAAMGHSFVLLKPGTDGLAFSTKAASATATDYIPEDAKASIIAHTKLVGGGESDTIEFELPGPGTYPFLCPFPGHYALMHGELVATAEGEAPAGDDKAEDKDEGEAPAEGAEATDKPAAE